MPGANGSPGGRLEIAEQVNTIRGTPGLKQPSGGFRYEVGGFGADPRADAAAHQGDGYRAAPRAVLSASGGHSVRNRSISRLAMVP